LNYPHNYSGDAVECLSLLVEEIAKFPAALTQKATALDDLLKIIK
jgi:hypothetical protein